MCAFFSSVAIQSNSVQLNNKKKNTKSSREWRTKKKLTIKISLRFNGIAEINEKCSKETKRKKKMV